MNIYLCGVYVLHVALSVHSGVPDVWSCGDLVTNDDQRKEREQCHVRPGRATRLLQGSRRPLCAPVATHGQHREAQARSCEHLPCTAIQESEVRASVHTHVSLCLRTSHYTIRVAFSGGLLQERQKARAGQGNNYPVSSQPWRQEAYTAD